MFGGFSLHFQYAIKSKSRGWFFKSLKRLLTGVAESISHRILRAPRGERWFGTIFAIVYFSTIKLMCLCWILFILMPLSSVWQFWQSTVLFSLPPHFSNTHIIYIIIYIYIYNKNFIQVLHTARKKLLTVRTVGFL